jgi:steroid delta-isomerase-like uncharacterized protein
MKKNILYLLTASLLVFACNNDKKTESTDKKETMAPTTENRAEKNKSTALASVTAFSNHDVDAMLKESTADGMDYGDGSMPAIKGIDSVKTIVKAWLAAFPDTKGENFMVLSDDGTHVAVIADWSGTFKNDFMGIKATGKSYKVRDADVFTFNAEGKITEHRSIQWNMTIMSQIGAKMPG